MNSPGFAHLLTSVVVYRDIDDADLTSIWQSVISFGSTWTVFQERLWLAEWWAVFGRGELFISVAYVYGKPVAIAPFFIDGGMAFLVGSGSCDYLDIIGCPATLEITRALVGAVLREYPDLLGLRFYHVPDASPTGAQLQDTAQHLGLICFDEGTLPAPLLDMGRSGECGIAAAAKKSLVRHQRYFERDGMLRIDHLRTARTIVPLLTEFFEQHEQRWAQSDSPSLFVDPKQRVFYRRLAETADAVSWLRFTVVRWNDRPVAFHFGFSHRDCYLWYKPSFDISHARHSPGEVLIRQLLLAAAKEGVRLFDFGLGAEAFKQRFATRVPLVRTWGLYSAR